MKFIEVLDIIARILSIIVMCGLGLFSIDGVLGFPMLNKLNKSHCRKPKVVEFKYAFAELGYNTRKVKSNSILYIKEDHDIEFVIEFFHTYDRGWLFKQYVSNSNGPYMLDDKVLKICCDQLVALNKIDPNTTTVAFSMRGVDSDGR